jgi:hypothetical protein
MFLAPTFLEFPASYQFGRFLAFRGRALQFPGARGFLPKEGRETARLSITIRFLSKFPGNANNCNQLELSGFL